MNPECPAAVFRINKQLILQPGDPVWIKDLPVLFHGCVLPNRGRLLT